MHEPKIARGQLSRHGRGIEEVQGRGPRSSPAAASLRTASASASSIVASRKVYARRVRRLHRVARDEFERWLDRSTPPAFIIWSPSAIAST